MVTRIRKGVIPHVYLREWRRAKGLDAVTLAGRLDIERESYYRLEREPRRISVAELGALAEALGTSPARLFTLPDTESLDAIVGDADADLRATAADIVRRLVSKAG